MYVCVLFSASRTTSLKFTGTNDSELKNVAGLVRRGSLELVIQVGRCPVVQNRTSKAPRAPTDVYQCAVSSFESPMARDLGEPSGFVLQSSIAQLPDEFQLLRMKPLLFFQMSVMLPKSPM